MDVLISHESALEYWRTVGAAHRSRYSQRARRAPGSIPDIADLKQLGNLSLSLPLHVIVDSDGSRRFSRTFAPHVYSHMLPSGSVVKVSDGLQISSPELCFLQMAAKLPAVKLIELGLELCGTYSKPAQVSTGESDNEACVYNVQPLTSVRKLTGFLDRAKGVRAMPRRKAIWALQHIADGSASPMETTLFMLLTLPYKLGGYSLPTPKLNHRVDLSRSAEQEAGQQFYVCDLFWPGLNVAAEYDSDEHHTGPLRIARDSRRRNRLALAGVSVITVTNEQVKSAARFESEVVAVLASHLGKRLRHADNPQFTEAQREVRTQLSLRQYWDGYFW